MHDYTSGEAEFRKELDFRNGWIVMIRSLRMESRELPNPRVHETVVHRKFVAVLRTDTGALAE